MCLKKSSYTQGIILVRDHGIFIREQPKNHWDNIIQQQTGALQLLLRPSLQHYRPHLTITAPNDSPNTNGLKFGCCSNIHISNTHIGTGYQTGLSWIWSCYWPTAVGENVLAALSEFIQRSMKKMTVCRIWYLYICVLYFVQFRQTLGLVVCWVKCVQRRTVRANYLSLKSQLILN